MSATPTPTPTPTPVSRATPTHRRAARLTETFTHPLTPEEARGLALFLSVETYGKAVDHLIRSETADLDRAHHLALRAARAKTKKAVWALGVLLVRAVMGDAIDQRVLEMARRRVQGVIPALCSRMEKAGAIRLFAPMLDGVDQADARATLAMIARACGQIGINVPSLEPGAVMEWEWLTWGEVSAANLNDVFIWIEQVAAREGRLFALQWKAATWYFKRWMCAPEGPGSALALFDRIKEWFYIDRVDVAEGAQPLYRAWLEFGAPSDDEERRIMSSLAFRVVGSECGVFVVREASEDGLMIAHIVTGHMYDVEEPASHRATCVGDYVFGRVLRRVPPEVLAKYPDADRAMRRSDLSPGTVVLTLADAWVQEVIRRYVEGIDETFEGAFVVETALRIAGGEVPHPRMMLPAESPEEARALYAEMEREMQERQVGTPPTAEHLADVHNHPEEWPEGPLTREPDSAITEWMAALREQGKVRARS